MKIEAIDHVHILVDDLERAMKFFSDIMGTKFIGPIDHRPRYNARVAFDNAGLELVCPTTPDHPVAKYGKGLYGISLKVPDMDEAIAELEAKGVKLERRGELPGLKFCTLDRESTYGCRIELLEYDTARPITIANLGKTRELPWFKG